MILLLDGQHKLFLFLIDLRRLILLLLLLLFYRRIVMMILCDSLFWQRQFVVWQLFLHRRLRMLLFSLLIYLCLYFCLIFILPITMLIIRNAGSFLYWLFLHWRLLHRLRLSQDKWGLNW